LFSLIRINAYSVKLLSHDLWVLLSVMQPLGLGLLSPPTDREMSNFRDLARQIFSFIHSGSRPAERPLFLCSEGFAVCRPHGLSVSVRRTHLAQARNWKLACLVSIEPASYRQSQIQRGCDQIRAKARLSLPSHGNRHAEQTRQRFRSLALFEVFAS
jgi:hypothetical protein